MRRVSQGVFRGYPAKPAVIAILAIPVLIEGHLNLELANGLNKKLGVAHCVVCPSALIGAFNSFEVVVAVAITCSVSGSERHRRISLQMTTADEGHRTLERVAPVERLQVVRHLRMADARLGK